MKMRTQEEIAEEYRITTGPNSFDMFGFRSTILIRSMTFATASPLNILKDDTTEREWNEFAQIMPEDVLKEAKEYVSFALDKIEGHRGLSADRSVAYMQTWAWLLCRDDVVEAMERADYKPYGAPMVKAFVDGLGLPWPKDNEVLNRMANGQDCTDDWCYSGCNN